MRTPFLANAIVVASVAFSLAIAALIAVLLEQNRSNVWRDARRSSENVAGTIANDIAHRIDMYGFVLREVAEDLGDPGIVLTPATRQRILARAAGVSDHIGSLVLLGRDGAIEADAAQDPPRQANFDDRDYFTAHRDGTATGLYVSRPYRSRLRGGDPSIAFSVRRDDPGGGFAGVAMIALSLGYFVDVIAGVDVGAGGVVSIIRDDGSMISRWPSADGKGDIDLDLSSSPVFMRIAAEGSGAFVGRSPIDGVERYYAFKKVAGAPMSVTVGVAVDTILAAWRLRAWLIGGATAALCLAGIAMAVLVRREMQRRAESEAKLAEMSVTDALTGLANRRRFDEVLAREWRRTQRTASPLALLLIDADHFKRLNDRFGHTHGDQALRDIARIIADTVRGSGDLVARIGGEEFAVVLPDTDMRAAIATAERVRHHVASARTPAGNGAGLEVTVSIGVATVVPGTGQTQADLVAAADRALYDAKEGGRNRVAVAAPGAAAPDPTVA